MCYHVAEDTRVLQIRRPVFGHFEGRNSSREVREYAPPRAGRRALSSLSTSKGQDCELHDACGLGPPHLARDHHLLFLFHLQKGPTHHHPMRRRLEALRFHRRDVQDARLHVRVEARGGGSAVGPAVGLLLQQEGLNEAVLHSLPLLARLGDCSL